ncbi:patatin-like phospholipase family protein [Alicyclobacillus fastidiosus]|uniref:Patatin-like phospholipase family protein n=1 Tax=Alicyclobacillus fastidiosus TaxID=392011 RepID=A0ABV5AB48_9BACL|nr:patatin-like phospholipase family protein [Alicyclobacillus fastidiosus]WEH11820.1 patatin-like phospholipase family protein [Alicyclobacillus fastidiosus]
MSLQRSNRPKLGLALSGGTLKAAAHIGVLSAFEKLGIQPDVVAGTSAGSLVSVLYAHGYRDDQFRQLLRTFPGLRLFDYGFPVWSSLYSWTISHLRQRTARTSTIPAIPTGLMRGQKLTRYVERLIEHRQVQIPFYIVATDLVSGKPIVFASDHARPSDAYVQLKDVARAVTGSCALPGIFSPVALDEYILVDGAMRHYIPVSVLKDAGCDKIIAVNLYRLPANYEPITLVDVLARSFDILLRESIDNDIAPGPELYVLEPDLSSVKWRKFAQMADCVAIGQQLVLERRMELQAFLRSRP